MSLGDNIQAELQKDELTENWREIINGVIDDEQSREELLNWIEDFRDEFIELTEIVDDQEEVHEALVIRYIEAKCHWMNLNTHMQYKMVKTGEQDTKLMARGSLISNLLEELEQFLEPDEVKSLTNFLAQPIDELASDDNPSQ